MNSVVESPEKLKKFLAKTRMENADKPMGKLMSLLRDGLKIGFALAGKNDTDLEDKTMKIVSPRFLSVMPEEDDNNSTVSVLG